MRECHLLKLPPELRLSIYDVLLEDSPKTVCLHMYMRSNFNEAATPTLIRKLSRTKHYSKLEDMISLMKSCKRLHREIGPVLRSHMSFELTLHNNCLSTSSVDWLKNGYDYFERSSIKYFSQDVLRVPMQLEIVLDRGQAAGRVSWSAGGGKISLLHNNMTCLAKVLNTNMDSIITEITVNNASGFAPTCYDLALENSTVLACKMFASCHLADDLCLRYHTRRQRGLSELLPYIHEEKIDWQVFLRTLAEKEEAELLAATDREKRAPSSEYDLSSEGEMSSEENSSGEKESSSVQASSSHEEQEKGDVAPPPSLPR